MVAVTRHGAGSREANRDAGVKNLCHTLAWISSGCEPQAPGGCSPKLARSATQREAPGNNKPHQDLHQSLFSLVACWKTTRLPLHVFLCKVQGSLQPFPDWEGPSRFGNPDRAICTQYLLPSAQQPALASRRMSVSGAKGGTAARSWGSIAELLAWVRVQHFKGAAAAATQILCLLAKQCHLRVICPVTTSLDASPSQTIKQEACFPRFVITRSRCSCLNLSFQAARAASTSSATCVTPP